MHKKFDKDHAWGSGNILSDRQTDRQMTHSQMHSSQYFATALEGEVINKKIKARFSRLLRHLAWKRGGLILVSALHKFVTYLLRHVPTSLQPRNPHGATN